jgi:hypothetical protein
MPAVKRETKRPTLPRVEVITGKKRRRIGQGLNLLASVYPFDNNQIGLRRLPSEPACDLVFV